MLLNDLAILDDEDKACKAGAPGVFAKVSFVLDWINGVMNGSVEENPPKYTYKRVIGEQDITELVTIETPVTPETPVTLEPPVTPETPVTPEPPVTSEQPVTPEPDVSSARSFGGFFTLIMANVVVGSAVLHVL